MKNLLEYLLIHLVENPEEVAIQEADDYHGKLYTITVHPDDMGRVIGKGGKVIKAIRKIAQAKAMKEGIRAKIVLEG